MNIPFSCLFTEFEWSFSQDLSAILVKQEEPDVGQRLDPQPLEGPPLILSPAPPHRGSPWKHTVSNIANDHVVGCCPFLSIVGVYEFCLCVCRSAVKMM